MSAPVTRYWPHAGNRIQLGPSRPPSAKIVQGRGCSRRPRPRSAGGRMLRASRTEWRGKNGSRQSLRGFDGSRFSRAIRSEKTEAFARLHFEVEAVDCNHVLVRFSQMADAKGRVGCDFRHKASIASRDQTFKTRIE